MTGDTAKAKNFYGELLGWQAHDLDMGEVVCTIFKNGERDVAGMLQTPQGQENIPPHWMSYIAVSDLEEKQQQAVSLGATLVVPAKEVPGAGKFCVFQDPTGAHIALWQKI